jgi:hypothetical protein
LDKTFNTRAKDMTPLKKASKERSLIHVPISDKRYEFKDVWEENIPIPDFEDWPSPRVTEGVTVTSGSTDSTITIIEMEYEDSDTVTINSPIYYPNPYRNYYMDTNSTLGATY